MHCASTYEHSLFEERRCDDKRIGADMLYLQCEDTSGAGREVSRRFARLPLLLPRVLLK